MCRNSISDAKAKQSGIYIKNNEYKLTQFADDTTLLLDGSEESLQASLNVLEIYGSMSGLKMNSDKTKIIWIGRKKFSKEKYVTDIKLTWGITDFELPGIKFTVSLNDITQINFNPAINSMQNET